MSAEQKKETPTVAPEMTFHPQPAIAGIRPWAFPTPERSRLGNGLSVLSCHRPGRQVIAVELSLDAPLHAEPEGLDGVSTITARALTEGTAHRSGEEFAAALERCGATLDVQSDHPGIRISLEVPVSHLDEALSLVAESVREPAFPQEEIERLIANRLDEITHELASPGRRAVVALFGELFDADDRISRPRQGSEETVKRIDRAAVAAFHAAHIRPATARAVLVGDFTGLDPAGLLERAFGTWTGQPGGAPAVMGPVSSDDAARVIIVDRPGSVQTQVLLARTGPDRHDPDWAELVIGTYCLGGALTSRLGLVLREEKGYTYGIHAYPNVLRSNAEGTGGALLGIQCSVETKVTGDALADIFTVLRELTTRPLNDAERDAAVQYLVGVAPMRYETAAAVADTFADQWEQGLPEDYQARQYERLARVVTERASDAVVRAFPPERLVVVLVGDAAKITDSVRALDIGPVEVRA